MRGLLLLLPAVILTGCHTSYLAPGAKGKVVDATTGASLPNAMVTRLPFQQVYPMPQVPATTVSVDRHGSFDLPPRFSTEIAFMYRPNPDSMTGTYLVYAEGYATNQIQGISTSRSRWRARLEIVPLERL